MDRAVYTFQFDAEYNILLKTQSVTTMGPCLHFIFSLFVLLAEKIKRFCRSANASDSQSMAEPEDEWPSWILEFPIMYWADRPNPESLGLHSLLNINRKNSKNYSSNRLWPEIFGLWNGERQLNQWHSLVLLNSFKLCMKENGLFCHKCSMFQLLITIFI